MGSKLKLGSLLLDLVEGDAVHIGNFDSEHPLDNPSVESFQFGDGTTLSWDALLERGSTWMAAILMDDL